MSAEANNTFHESMPFASTIDEADGVEASSYLGAVKRFIPDPSRPFTVFQPKARAGHNPTTATPPPPPAAATPESDVTPEVHPRRSEMMPMTLSSLQYAPPTFNFNAGQASFPTSPGKQTFDTLSSVTHHETESVVSSWIDDDDYFVSAAMHDVQIVHMHPPTSTPYHQYEGGSSSTPVPVGQQPRRSAGHQRRGGPQGGWKESNQRRNRIDGKGTATTTATGVGKSPVASVSGGRFDALATDKRRW